MFEIKMAMIIASRLTPDEDLKGVEPSWFPIEDRADAHRRLDILLDTYEKIFPSD